jgi:hypothetical protein
MNRRGVSIAIGLATIVLSLAIDPRFHPSPQTGGFGTFPGLDSWTHFVAVFIRLVGLGLVLYGVLASLLKED